MSARAWARAAVLALAWPGAAWGAGSVSAAYLLGPMGPQQDALGQAGLAAWGGAAAQWSDPAALAGASDVSLSLSDSLGPLDGNGVYAAVSGALGRRRALRLGLQGYVWDQGDTYRDGAGNVGGSFNDQESLVGLSLAQSFGPLSLGLGTKVPQQTLAGRSAAGGLLADLGLLGRAWDDRLVAGLAWSNLGIMPSADGTDGPASPESLDLALREELGTARAWRLFQGLRLVHPNADLNGEAAVLGQTAELLVQAGLEVGFSVGAFPVALRAGYAGQSGGLLLPAGLATGFGVRWRGASFDYAFTALGDLGSRQSLGLSWGFTLPPPPPRPARRRRHRVLDDEAAAEAAEAAPNQAAVDDGEATQRRQAARHWLQVGDERRELMDLAGAIGAYRLAQAADPQSRAACLGLAEAFRTAGDDAQGDRYEQLARTLAPPSDEPAQAQVPSPSPTATPTPTPTATPTMTPSPSPALTAIASASVTPCATPAGLSAPGGPGPKAR
jgi:hypothetical protein